jgi:hypothetical protein
MNGQGDILTGLLSASRDNVYFFILVYPTKTHVTIFACSPSNFVMKILGR